MLTFDGVSKNVTSYSKCFAFFESYLVRAPNFKSTNSSLPSKKKYGRGNFVPNPRHRLRGQNTLVEIGLIELIGSSDTLNYRPLFKHCILQTVLHVFLLFIFVWNKIFCSKKLFYSSLSLVLHLFDLFFTFVLYLFVTCNLKV